jgi:hypothetical protein
MKLILYKSLNIKDLIEILLLNILKIFLSSINLISKFFKLII